MEKTIIARLQGTMKRIEQVYNAGAFLSLAVEVDAIRRDSMYKELNTEVKSVADEYVQVTHRLIVEHIDHYIDKVAKVQDRTPDEVYQTAIQNVLDQQYGVVALGTLLEAACHGPAIVSCDFLAQTAESYLRKPVTEGTKKVPADLGKPYVEDDIAEVLVDAVQKMHIKDCGRACNWSGFTFEQREKAQKQMSQNKTIQLLDKYLSDIGGTQGLKKIGRAGGVNKILGIVPIVRHKDRGIVCQLNRPKQPSIGE